jgi:hypothetical protein
LKISKKQLILALLIFNFSFLAIHSQQRKGWTFSGGIELTSWNSTVTPGNFPVG